jgi:glycerate-2-kinase
MTSGADITALNAVRKHLSAVKGGRLASACAGRMITLAISDVVGDDLGVIGSGPGVPDASTWADALEVLRRFGGAGHDAQVVARVEAGCRGELPETPKAGDPSMARASAHVIGGRLQAMRAAAAEGRALGYEVAVHDPAVTGEARIAARAWWAQTGARVGTPGRPLLIVSSGETTVRVTGPGRGGRNQEFALAAARPLADAPVAAALLSRGTDGVDGPTDAAGALVDGATLARADAAGLPTPDLVLDRNDSYPFFDALSDLVRTGPTGTNVGDLQLLLVAPGLIR